MWLLHVSVLVCSGWPGSKMPPWKQALWRWAALEGFPSQISSKTPKILEKCQSASKLIFTSTSTTTSLWRWSSRWNCSPVLQAEPTDSRNESSSMLWRDNVFYEQDKNCTAVQSTLLCSSSSEKWGQQHDTTDYDYVIMTTILYKWNDDVIVEWICECVIRIPYEQVLQHSWGGPASSCPCLPPAFNWYILISRRHFEQNLQEYKKRPVEHWPNRFNAS